MHRFLDAEDVPHALECAEEGEVHKSLQVTELQDTAWHVKGLLVSKNTWQLDFAEMNAHLRGPLYLRICGDLVSHEHIPREIAVREVKLDLQEDNECSLE